MRNIIFLLLLSSACYKGTAQNNSEYSTAIVYPASYAVGDYIEFLRVQPYDAGASGFYEISISYTRGSVAAAATFIASISHSNPAVWREVGAVNNNYYVNVPGCITVDCNTEYNNARFRLRATKVMGVLEHDLPVFIKVRAINNNSSWTSLNNRGNDLSVSDFLPMTCDWSLYVGNPFYASGASLAIKAITNGNVGIGTDNPTQKLSVNGTVLAKKMKVSQPPSVDWPDYVFDSSYLLTPLPELEKFIQRHKHLPQVPSAGEVAKEGVDLGDNQAVLLKKIEELTLYIIEQNKKMEAQELRIKQLEKKNYL
jgi:hypothetical protein